MQIRSLLNLPTLASRRELTDISFMYKVINNHIDAPYLSHNIPAYNKRSSSVLYLPSHTAQIIYNILEFQEPLCSFV